MKKLRPITIMYKRNLKEHEFYNVYSPFGFEILTQGPVYDKQRMHSALMEHLVWDKIMDGYKNYITICNSYTSAKAMEDRLNEIEIFIKNNALHLNDRKYKSEEERYTKVRRLFKSTFEEFKDLYYVLYGVKIDVKHLTKYFKHINV